MIRSSSIFNYEADLLPEELPISQDDHDRIFLQVNGFGWGHLPSLIAFHHITIFEAVGNRLTEVPARVVVELPYLHTLNVSRNMITELPPNIGDWTNMKRICAAYNQISAFPKSLTLLKKLEYVNLKGNTLDESLEWMMMNRTWSNKDCHMFAEQVLLVTQPLETQEDLCLLEEEEEPIIQLRSVAGAPRISHRAPTRIPVRIGQKSFVQPVLEKTRDVGIDEGVTHRYSRGNTVLALADDPASQIRRRARSRLTSRGETAERTGSRFSVSSRTNLGWGSGERIRMTEDVSRMQLMHNSSICFVPDATHSAGSFNGRQNMMQGSQVCSKLACFASCIYGILTTLTGIFVDQGLLTNFLDKYQSSGLNYIPKYMQEAFVANHNTAVFHLSGICASLPLYRSPNRGNFATFVTFVAWVASYFWELVVSSRYSPT